MIKLLAGSLTPYVRDKQVCSAEGKTSTNVAEFALADASWVYWRTLFRRIPSLLFCVISIKFFYEQWQQNLSNVVEPSRLYIYTLYVLRYRFTEEDFCKYKHKKLSWKKGCLPSNCRSKALFLWQTYFLAILRQLAVLSFSNMKCVDELLQLAPGTSRSTNTSGK